MLKGQPFHELPEIGIGGIYESLDITDNPHLSGEMDYFQKLQNHFVKQFELNKQIKSNKKR